MSPSNAVDEGTTARARPADAARATRTPRAWSGARPCRRTRAWCCARSGRIGGARPRRSGRRRGRRRRPAPRGGEQRAVLGEHVADRVDGGDGGHGGLAGAQRRRADPAWAEASGPSSLPTVRPCRRRRSRARRPACRLAGRTARRGVRARVGRALHQVVDDGGRDERDRPAGVGWPRPAPVQPARRRRPRPGRKRCRRSAGPPAARRSRSPATGGRTRACPGRRRAPRLSRPRPAARAARCSPSATGSVQWPHEKPSGSATSTTASIASAADRARRGCSGALYPQSALAGPNSLSRGRAFRVSAPLAASMAGSRAVSAREPGQVRKEAALSGHRQA